MDIVLSQPEKGDSLSSNYLKKCFADTIFKILCHVIKKLLCLFFWGVLAHGILHCSILMKQANSSPRLDKNKKITGETAHSLN